MINLLFLLAFIITPLAHAAEATIPRDPGTENTWSPIALPKELKVQHRLDQLPLERLEAIEKQGYVMPHTPKARLEKKAADAAFKHSPLPRAGGGAGKAGAPPHTAGVTGADALGQTHMHVRLAGFPNSAVRPNPPPPKERPKKKMAMAKPEPKKEAPKPQLSARDLAMFKEWQNSQIQALKSDQATLEALKSAVHQLGLSETLGDLTSGGINVSSDAANNIPAKEPVKH
ncbi:MAG: hypothetical protein EBZ69_03205 [Alphaproteobacteria bacterium]|nr:hypothetical protein [Alphaproteobacteria bacterium]